ncbi:AlpA family transcriptional regulator [Bradyrhizobium sp. WSM2793]|uniref:helix-turn-helix transcriptional regulator n=1 Tax=Bradyrhizobium sp. WSM2793 TaxID=1038866 RepID=UPI000676032B|nr:AlpA family phage regulatory protein [Bradyrhizobium sp. WSM2793]
MSIIFLRLPAVKARTGLKETTIYKGISEGTFPPSFPLTERCVGWREDQIAAWCKAKAEGRAIRFDSSAARRR